LATGVEEIEDEYDGEERSDPPSLQISSIVLVIVLVLVLDL
jgi:hypothetical protein